MIVKIEPVEVEGADNLFRIVGTQKMFMLSQSEIQDMEEASIRPGMSEHDAFILALEVKDFIIETLLAADSRPAPQGPPQAPLTVAPTMAPAAPATAVQAKPGPLTGTPAAPAPAPQASPPGHAPTVAVEPDLEAELADLGLETRGADMIDLPFV
tara:strand:- start:980 stop:1444 length:465 start_codon:yes stop_codon:yes gene_type:complete